jgi:threonyl-tRNA synthetase
MLIIEYNVVGNLKTGFTRPVIVHRAIFGSLERFIAILCEQTGGKWDFWLSPRQIKLLPIGKDAK